MIWIIGCNGLLGNSFQEEFNKNNVKYWGTDKDVDVTDFNNLHYYSSKLKNIQWIINCSGYTNVDKAESDKEKAWNLNVEGTKNIAEIAKVFNANLIHFSTNYVFDGMKDSPYLENDDTNPLSFYGETKLESEKSVQESWDKYFIFRLAGLYGYGGIHFIHKIINKMKRGEDLQIVNDQMIAPTFSANTARIICKFILDNPSHFGIYHFTDKGNYSWCDFSYLVQDIAFHIGLIHNKIHINGISSEQFNSPAVRPLNGLLNCDLFEQTSGYSMKSCEDSVYIMLSKAKELDLI